MSSPNSVCADRDWRGRLILVLVLVGLQFGCMTAQRRVEKSAGSAATAATVYDPDHALASTTPVGAGPEPEARTNAQGSQPQPMRVQDDAPIDSAAVQVRESTPEEE
jgi:hypothetical protein